MDQPAPDGADTETAGPVGQNLIAGNEVQTGATSCDTRTGKVTAKTLNTDECTKGCSQKHEDKHAADIGPCCANAGKASKALSSEDEKVALQNRFDAWMIANRPRLECSAYDVSISCGDARHKSLGCEKNSYVKCCKELVHYIRSARIESPKYCAHADEKLSSCPFQ
jgi:hypothetical protein